MEEKKKLTAQEEEERLAELEDKVDGVMGIILFGFIIPAIHLYGHLTACPYCAESGLNPLCLLRCLWSVPIALIFIALFYSDYENKKGDK